jgi:hypothetical protein
VDERRAPVESPEAPVNSMAVITWCGRDVTPALEQGQHRAVVQLVEVKRTSQVSTGMWCSRWARLSKRMGGALRRRLGRSPRVSASRLDLRPATRVFSQPLDLAQLCSYHDHGSVRSPPRVPGPAAGPQLVHRHITACGLIRNTKSQLASVGNRGRYGPW